ncbi:MAG: hypothetical protein DI551_00750 [Micavibrio aeruginosavorus]|uniref:Uncharacterized protein n=1 Tax=Micavibrio aeruginosavorus TaxID=349221 RepID=A0A2W5N5Z0_9BACT|nr:MAG: hypothetical protein DI551_00750 [Micavibrio aeruginosavorus]
MTITTYDDLGICIAALAALGEGGIHSIEDPQTDVEAVCAVLFPLVLGTLLSMHEWNFANPVRQLAADPDVMEDDRAGYAYAHRLPANLLAGPFGVYSSPRRTDRIADYLVSGNYILSNSAVVFARYCARTDIANMPLYFIDLAVTACSARFAKPITDNTALAEEKRIEAFGPADMNGRGGMFANAVVLDARSRPMKSIFANGDPLTAARY